MFKCLLLSVYVCLIVGISVKACDDKDIECPDWKIFCGDNEFVDKTCKRTCGNCPTTTTTGGSCVDKDDKCPAWKLFCGSGNVYVDTNCKKTCDACPTTGEGGGGGGGGSGSNTWSSCSKTCGMGTRFKETCQSGNCSKEWEACEIQDCPEASCGNNERKRNGMPHACCTIDSYSSECGKQFINTQRVIKGDPAIFKKYPWIVAINATGAFISSEHYCAGSLVSIKHVVTAAHCLANPETGIAYPLNSFVLSFGLLRLNDSPMAIRTVKRVHFRPLTTNNINGKVFDYPRDDIAVIELSQSVTKSSSIYPICLPHGEITPKDTTGFVAGWGIDSANGILSLTHLQEAAVQNLDVDICRAGYAKYSSLMPNEASFSKTSKDILCAGSIHEIVNTCRGDSGGPLVFQRCESCSWYLAGIVSFGHPDCTKKIPGAYTKVLNYEDWIRGIIKEEPDSFYCSRNVGP
uniref:brain-specific serine protease 4-like n=1 Tax=Styela clava TaxID=7725 RepID=UPI00193A1B2E|nr:brain-specific serine protease 4-like [Styela clava]